ncbi:MAG TPA: methionine synthase [Clostridia bacterium]|nr:methionine synthase [Clostridia bacterium]
MRIDKKEALRYMGYRGQEIDHAMQDLLEACMEEVRSVSRENYTYRIFDIERKPEGLYLKGTTLLLRGSDIEVHLEKSVKCAVMAVSLGLEIDKRLSFYSRTDLTRSLVFDACAAAAVEALCDEVQERIEAEAGELGLQITARFSPGYGDFSIDIQKELIRTLKTYEKFGLGVNESSIMIPRKSVTAVIGMQEESCGTRGHKCISCDDKNCAYRKDVDENE